MGAAGAVRVRHRAEADARNLEAAFAEIDVQLKQRYDLIPQLLGAVKGYMNHESEVLTRVTEARAGYLRAGTIAEKIEAENKMTSAMNGLNIQLEAYPDLKANTNFMHLQQEIGDMENKLAAVRRFFNSSTKEYNNGIEQFPSNIIAKSKGYKTEPMFDLGVDQRQTLDKAPEVALAALQ